MLRIILCVAICHMCIFMCGQGKLIINDNAYIVMQNDVYLVVEDPASDAVTTAGAGGNIVSEDEQNYVKWSIGNSIGTYVIPFTTASGDKIPMTYTTSDGGLGNGTISFSTYNCATWDNYNYRPTAVTNMTNDGVLNASAFVIDRFWQTLAEGYTTLPSGEIAFSYIDAEHTATGNAIIEAELRAERYEPVADDWEYFSPAGTINTASNTLSAVPFSASDFMTNWTLIDQTAHLLPLSVIDFSGDCGNDEVLLTWKTASEQSTDHFTVFASEDGSNFIPINEIQAAGNSTETIQYSTSVDANGPYFNLQCIDLDGSTHQFGTIFLPCANAEEKTLYALDGGYETMQVFCSGWHGDKLSLQVYDLSGRSMLLQPIMIAGGTNEIIISTALWADGMYLIRMSDEFGEDDIVRVLLVD